MTDTSSTSRRRTGIGDWIRVADSFFSKPKVLRIAELIGGQMEFGARTKTLHHVAVSGLVRVFLTLNRHAHEIEGTKDAELSDVHADNYLDEISGVPGLQAAMISVGWAVHDRERALLRFPNYLAYNDLAKGSKRRGRPGDPNSSEAARKRAARAKVAGQMPDKSPPPAPTLSGQMPDNEPEKEGEREQREEKSSKKEPVPIDPMAKLRREVDALRPDTWGSVPHWGYDDEAALSAARVAIEGWRASRPDLDGRSTFDLLRWWLAWTGRQARREGNENNARFAVTSKRAAFLEGLGGYVGRAKHDWLSERQPNLGAPVNGSATRKPPSTAPVPPVALPTVTPEQARQNAARFRELVGHGETH